MMVEEMRLDSTVVKFFDDYIDEDEKDGIDDILKTLNLWIMKTIENNNDCNCNFNDGQL